ncbi:hypothetical protein [Ectobacillus sp. sgz5001026]|uniref:hypothetical protein n=1 Tax=Ectobacillus sp. sgz5001026 TaxID=3242473 RepID=UPI0036D420B5
MVFITDNTKNLISVVPLEQIKVHEHHTDISTNESYVAEHNEETSATISTWIRSVLPH